MGWQQDGAHGAAHRSSDRRLGVQLAITPDRRVGAWLSRRLFCPLAGQPGESNHRSSRRPTRCIAMRCRPHRERAHLPHRARARSGGIWPASADRSSGVSTGIPVLRRSPRPVRCTGRRSAWARSICDITLSDGAGPRERAPTRRSGAVLVGWYFTLAVCRTDVLGAGTPGVGRVFAGGISGLVAGSAGLPVAVQDGGVQGCWRRAERRQDGRNGPVVHGDEGEREVFDADVVVVPCLRLE
jgi:hypothetical protein